MNKSLSHARQVHRVVLIGCGLALSGLLAACGGGEDGTASATAASREKAQAAALAKAAALARSTNEAKMRGEHAPGN